MEEEPSQFYKNKIFSGPMMKVSNLPFRLLCLEYGADSVYGPACNCDTLLAATTLDSDPGTFYLGNPLKKEVLFRTSIEEKGKIVFQLFTNDSSKSVLAINRVFPFISAVDLNCGCPSNFATSKGHGSAMMKSPEIVSDIIKTIKRNFPDNFPVSIKFRIEDEIEKSIQFAKMVESSGASALALHGRNVESRHKGEVKYEEMKIIFEQLNQNKSSIAKIGNGGIKTIEDAHILMDKIKCDSVIIASEALKNPSVFLDNKINIFHAVNSNQKNNINININNNINLNNNMNINDNDVIVSADCAHTESDNVPKYFGCENILSVAKRFIDICEEKNCQMSEFRFCLLEMLNKNETTANSLGWRRLSNAKDCSSMKEILRNEQLFQLV